ncbi:hypothetical protein FACS18949_05990 [Clostridia bacterium]|nr:hypothetical protein FACS18949_05990 [Clostridia bacterium]
MFITCYNITNPKNPAENGYTLLGYDLGGTIYTSLQHWESWPEKLYTPADFESGAVTDTPVRLTDADYRRIQYSTHRFTLTLPAGQLYALFVRSSDYATRLFVNGEEIGSVGKPGDTRETTVPRVQEKTYFFMAEDETVEILAQAANFVHGKDGGWPPDITIGTPENIQRHTTKLTAFRFAEVGCLLTAALYHLGLFFLNRRRKDALYLSICCVLFTLMTKSPIMTFLGDYNFNFWLREEYLTHFFVFLMMTLLINTLFPRAYHKWVLRGFGALVGVYTLLTLFTDTVFFTGILDYFEIASSLIIVYTVVRLAMSLRGSMKHLLAFFGVMGIAFPGLYDILYYRNIVLFERLIGHQFISPIGMMFFVFCYALVVAIKYAETERAMLIARESERVRAAIIDSVAAVAGGVISAVDCEGAAAADNQKAIRALDGAVFDSGSGALSGAVHGHIAVDYDVDGVAVGDDGAIGARLQG